MSTPGKGRVHVLDPLRGLAALAVGWFHFTGGGPLRSVEWIRSSGAFGWAGVEAFFVISGFVLPLSMYRGGYRLRCHVGTFVLKRVIRLDPPYIVTIGLVVALAYASALAPGYAGAPPSFSWTNVLLHLGYLNAFVGEGWINPVFWTLAIEFQFYLLIALLFPVIVRLPASWRGLGAVALAASPLVVTVPDSFIVPYLPLFAFGIATFEYYEGRVRLLAYLLTIGTISLIGLGTMGQLITGVGLATALAIAFVRAEFPRWVTGLGVLSYSFYLVHVPIGGRVVNLGARVAETPLQQIGVLLTAVAVSLLAAYAMYWAVERPAQRFSSAIQYRPAPPVATGFESIGATSPTPEGPS